MLPNSYCRREANSKLPVTKNPVLVGLQLQASLVGFTMVHISVLIIQRKHTRNMPYKYIHAAKDFHAQQVANGLQSPFPSPIKSACLCLALCKNKVSLRSLAVLLRWST